MRSGVRSPTTLTGPEIVRTAFVPQGREFHVGVFLLEQFDQLPHGLGPPTLTYHAFPLFLLSGAGRIRTDLHEISTTNFASETSVRTNLYVS